MSSSDFHHALVASSETSWRSSAPLAQLSSKPLEKSNRQRVLQLFTYKSSRMHPGLPDRSTPMFIYPGSTCPCHSMSIGPAPIGQSSLAASNNNSSGARHLSPVCLAPGLADLLRVSPWGPCDSRHSTSTSTAAEAEPNTRPLRCWFFSKKASCQMSQMATLNWSELSLRWHLTTPTTMVKRFLQISSETPGNSLPQLALFFLAQPVSWSLCSILMCILLQVSVSTHYLNWSFTGWCVFLAKKQLQTNSCQQGFVAWAAFTAGSGASSRATMRGWSPKDDWHILTWSDESGEPLRIAQPALELNFHVCHVWHSDCFAWQVPAWDLRWEKWPNPKQKLLPRLSKTSWDVPQNGLFWACAGIRLLHAALPEIPAT